MMAGFDADAWGRASSDKKIAMLIEKVGELTARVTELEQRVPAERQVGRKTVGP